MDVPLPSTRELELEMLLREKEGQVVHLSASFYLQTDEVSRLRLYLSVQPPPSTTEPVTLPPTFASLILPHISHLSQASDAAESSNSTTTAALTQRVRVLQDENDELYDILKRGETGRLKEEVQSLKRIVHKLEGALRESHQVIVTLSNELDKSSQALSASSTFRNTSPQNHYHSNGVKSHTRSHSNSGGRHPPTGPRAHAPVHKKPRLSLADQDPHQDEMSPSMRSNVSLPSSVHPGNSGRRGRSRSRSRSPRGKSNVRMEIDEVKDEHQRRSTERVRDRERWDRDRERGERSDRERGGDRGRDRDRDRDGNRSRRNGGGGRGGTRRGGGERQGSSGNGDRTLAERMGLGV
ncbi:hypothetical protein F5890DRAFT_1400521 [Lentinula detonsa]|uniref:Uncharacterized protein n=1 Tax=Lentinula detonsa TaxID=2804962 RepID=A0AA38UXZ2_9AGAR|nr:hypothetical protein F5890DRAFT_1400521 [Lentinula detonsa]